MNMKSSLRTKAKDIRKNLNLEKISEQILKKIKQHKFYQNAENIMIFYPTKYEINLLNLLNDKKKFYLPKVNGKDLLVCPYKKGEYLEKSSFNILEPCSNPKKPEILDLVIIPALMADKNGYRLGYGGGFYDRFIPTLKPECKTITVVPFELLTDNLPHEDFDIKTDLIITN